MRYLLILFFSATITLGVAQTPRADSLLAKIAVEKNDEKLIHLINALFTDNWTIEVNMRLGQRLVSVGQ